MNIIIALAVAVIFGAGVRLMVRSDAIRLAAGTVLITNAAVLLLVSAGFGANEAPLLPYENAEDLADPLVQALALTAVVISFGATVLLLRVTLALQQTHDTIQMSEIVKAEVADDVESQEHLNA